MARVTFTNIFTPRTPLPKAFWLDPVTGVVSEAAAEPATESPIPDFVAEVSRYLHAVADDAEGRIRYRIRDEIWLRMIVVTIYEGDTDYNSAINYEMIEASKAPRFAREWASEVLRQLREGTKS